jgi:hypothetical protein
MGKKVVDLHGFISYHFGGDTPVFYVTKVVFEDGTEHWLQGEHDIAYIPAQDDGTPLSEDNLMAIEPLEDEDDDEPDMFAQGYPDDDAEEEDWDDEDNDEDGIEDDEVDAEITRRIQDELDKEDD